MKEEKQDELIQFHEEGRSYKLTDIPTDKRKNRRTDGQTNRWQDK